MPVLEAENSAAVRSALRHRPISPEQVVAEPPVLRARRTRSTKAAPETTVIDSGDLEPSSNPAPDSQPPVQRTRRTRSTKAAPKTIVIGPDELEPSSEPDSQPSVAPGPRRLTPRINARWASHPWIFGGLGLLAFTLLWVGISWAVSWGTNELNTMRYGDPRTFQIDAVVGHGDSVQHPSHFLAINLHGTVTILEMPAGDPSHARVLASTTLGGPNASLAVVTLRFIDVNHQGKPDMLIDIEGIERILVNDQGTFRAPTAAEQQQILNALQLQSQS